MEELLRQLINDSQGLFAYGLIFGVLLACGLGIPLPEDISLILGGFLAYQGAARLPEMMAVGLGGILVGDSLIFFFGRRIGTRVGKEGGFFTRIVTPEKRRRVEGLFATHGQKIVMFARFLPGVRAVTFFTAGSAGMKYLTFILWDGFAALVSAPLFVFLGFKFGGELELLFAKIRQGKVVVGVALAAGIVAYLLYRYWRLRKLRASATKSDVQLELDGGS